MSRSAYERMMAKTIYKKPYLKKKKQEENKPRKKYREERKRKTLHRSKPGFLSYIRYNAILINAWWMHHH